MDASSRRVCVEKYDLSDSQRHSNPANCSHYSRVVASFPFEYIRNRRINKPPNGEENGIRDFPLIRKPDLVAAKMSS